MFAKRQQTRRPQSPRFAFTVFVFLLISASTCTGRECSTGTKPTPLVTGGRDAHEDRFPYMCSIRYRGKREHACGGILIKRRWLLTAAHCVDPYSADSAGMDPLIYCNIYRRNDNPLNKLYFAHATHLHGRWESDNVGKGYDIALIKLNRAAKLSVPTLAVAGSAYDSKTRVAVLGWGNTANNTLADKLQIGLNMEVMPNDICSKDDLWGEYIKKSMICAGTGVTDTRKGDSGGPLLILDGSQENNYTDGEPCVDLLVGMTSFGDEYTPEDEGPNPGVYTSIGFFREWIDCIIEGRIPKEDCPSENNTESSSADPTAISSDPPVDPPDAEESTPSTEDEDCIDFEPFGDDFEDEDALERMTQAIEIDDSVTVGCILKEGLLDANAKYTLIEGLLPVNTSLLHHATLHNAMKSAKVLLNYGSDVDIRDGREQTPLHIAAEYGSLGVAKVLIQEGAKLNAKSKRGDYPLHYATFYKHKSIVKFLITEGADVDSKNVNEETPLHLAAAKGFVSIVELLLENNASKVETTYLGETPLEVICEETNQNEDCADKTISKLEDLLSIH